MPDSPKVIAMRVDAVESQEAAAAIVAGAAASTHASPSRYVCAANVHMRMEAHDEPAFRKVVNDADLVLPVWMRDRSLEWPYRLTHVPRRSWRRHLRHEPRFAALLARQVLARRQS